MAEINKAALKAYFQTGKIPTQAQFDELIDFLCPSHQMMLVKEAIKL